MWLGFPYEIFSMSEEEEYLKLNIQISSNTVLILIKGVIKMKIAKKLKKSLLQND